MTPSETEPLVISEAAKRAAETIEFMLKKLLNENGLTYHKFKLPDYDNSGVEVIQQAIDEETENLNAVNKRLMTKLDCATTNNECLRKEVETLQGQLYKRDAEIERLKELVDKEALMLGELAYAVKQKNTVLSEQFSKCIYLEWQTGKPKHDYSNILNRETTDNA